MIVVFFLTIHVGILVMNKDRGNNTMAIESAAFPLLSMETEGQVYNTLHGYAAPRDILYMRGDITVLDENRSTAFTLETFGQEISDLAIEVRSMDGSRLVEQSPIKEYETIGNYVKGTIRLKDLLDSNTEYMLVVKANVNRETPVYFYTTVIVDPALYLKEKLDFVLDFHNRLFDKEQAKELTKYLETNPSLYENHSFSYVNIHASYKQMTYGELPVTQETIPTISLREISESTASLVLDFILSTGDGVETEKVYYQVQEYYRIRYTKDRVYLLDYERTMEQFPNTETMCINDKLVLGIVPEDVAMLESEDGSAVSFVSGGQLFCYNKATNKLAVVFSFLEERPDAPVSDARNTYSAHDIRILDIEEGGNVSFAVYGYMNRGRHEGEVGIELYNYDSAHNTIEEIMYIPYGKSFSMLQAEMSKLLYLNRDKHLYLTLENQVFCVDLEKRTYELYSSVVEEDSLKTSRDKRLLVSLPMEPGQEYAERLVLMNLKTESEITITTPKGDALKTIGFMGDDLIYGLAHKEDITTESSGAELFPMYRLCICDEFGNLLKTYESPGVYVTDCLLQDNQITLDRIRIDENGHRSSLPQDQITDTQTREEGKNKLAITAIDVYQRYVQIQLSEKVSDKLVVVTPKEVVLDGGRSLEIESEGRANRYLVYGPMGVTGIYNEEANAVLEAARISGSAITEDGLVIWKKKVRVSKNQIMAISEHKVTEDKGSLAVCLETMLGYEGIARDAQSLLNQGQSALEILENNLDDKQVLNLTGCSLDSVLYYLHPDFDKPVLALLKNGEAYLITGYNEYNVVLMDPVKGTLYKNGLGDSTDLFEANGNVFITYVDKNH